MAARMELHTPSTRRGRRDGLLLARIFGVEIRLDWSLLIIFLLVTVNLGAGLLPRWHPSWTALSVWSLAVTAAVLFFAALLAHELAHAFVARAMGVPVRRVTLFLFGGVAQLEGEPKSPKAEFLIAIVGPMTSLGLGLIATAIGAAMAGPSLSAAMEHGSEAMLAAIQALGPLPTILLWFGPLNLMLALFNLVPGFPLDGGRVLRSILWGVTRDVVKATRWASLAGQAVAWGLMGLGVMTLFRGTLMQGLWFLLIGWFLNNAAKASYQQLLMHQALEDVPVMRIMRTQLDRVGPDMPIEELVREHVLATDQHAYPVETADGVLLGLVCFDDLRKAPQSAWPHTPVREVMTALPQLATLPPDAGAEQALEQLAQRDVEQIPVLDDESHLLGLVRRQDLVRWLALQSPTLSAHP